MVASNVISSKGALSRRIERKKKEKKGEDVIGKFD